MAQQVGKLICRIASALAAISLGGAAYAALAAPQPFNRPLAADFAAIGIGIWLVGQATFYLLGRRALPHDHVYARLRRSNIHGVGVFAIRDIKKGTQLFSGDKAELVWVEQNQITNLPDEIKKLYEDFAIIKDGRHGCPSTFNRLTMSWYLNNSKCPNVVVDAGYNSSST